MAKCRNLGLCYGSNATNSTLLTSGKTCFSTSGSYCGNGFLSVAKCRNLGLCYCYGSAYSTLLTCGKTGFSTSGIYCGNGCLGVAECINYNLSQCYFTAYCTLLTCAKTCSGTCRSYCIQSLLGVAFFGNFSLCYSSCATYCTLLTLGKTCSGTSGGYFRNGFLGVALSISLVCNVRMVTYGAGVGGITACDTSGLGYCCLIVVSKCRNLGLCYGGNATNCTLLTCSKTGFGTGGGYCRKSFLSMSCKLAIFLATLGAYCSVLAGSGAAGAYVCFLLAAIGTSAVHEVVLSALKNRNDNVVDSNLNEVCAVLNVKLITTLTGVELYVTGRLIGRSLSLMLLRLGGVVVIFLNNLKGGSSGDLNVIAGLLDRENDNHVLAYTLCDRLADINVIHTVDCNEGSRGSSGRNRSIRIGNGAGKSCVGKNVYLYALSVYALNVNSKLRSVNGGDAGKIVGNVGSADLRSADCRGICINVKHLGVAGATDRN